MLEILHDITDWKRLGLALGLLYPTLKSIEKDSDRNDDCKIEMLAAWLRQQDNVDQSGVPSWSALRAALRRVGEKELASRIAVSCEYIEHFDGVCVCYEHVVPPSGEVGGEGGWQR